MSHSGRHIIHKLVLDMRSGRGGKRIHKLQSEAGRVLRHRLPDLLESMLAETAGADHVIIDRLEVDLGSIPSDQLETQLLEKLKPGLQKALDKERAESGIGNGAQMRSPGSGDREKPRRLSETRYGDEVLFHFLDTGTLPWFVFQGSETEPDAMAEQFRRLLRDHPDRIRRFLYGRRHDRKVLERILSLPDPVPDELLNRFMSVFSDQAKAFLVRVREQADSRSVHDIRRALLQTMLVVRPADPVRTLSITCLLHLSRTAPEASFRLLSALKKDAESGFDAKGGSQHPFGTDDWQELIALEASFHPGDEETADPADPELSEYFRHHSHRRHGTAEDHALLKLLKRRLRANARGVKSFLLARRDRPVMETISAVFEQVLNDLLNRYMPDQHRPAEAFYAFLKQHAGRSSLHDVRLAFLQSMLLTGSGSSIRPFLLLFFLRLGRVAPAKTDRMLSVLDSSVASSGDAGRIPGLDPKTSVELRGVLRHLRSSSGGVTRAEDPESETEPADRDRQPEKTGLDETLHIRNAGLVLFWPFLPRFFSHLELVCGDDFLDDKARLRAMQLLGYLESGEGSLPEYRMVLAKLMCGFPVTDPPGIPVALSASETEEADELLRSVIGHWKALKNTSVKGFRDSFVRRDGLLRQETDTWKLYVERKAFDVLLDKLPWSVSVVKLPWMKGPIMVEW